MRNNNTESHQVTHEVLPVKDKARNTTDFIIVRTYKGKDTILKLGGKKFYSDRTAANAAMGRL